MINVTKSHDPLKMFVEVHFILGIESHRGNTFPFDIVGLATQRFPNVFKSGR